MKNVLNLRKRIKVYLMLFYMYISNLWFNITKPFKIAYEIIKRYNELRKLKRIEDGWERYVREKELEKTDELELKRAIFSSTKTNMFCAFIRMIIAEGVVIVSKEEAEAPVEKSRIESSKEVFLKNKQELCSLIDELNEYKEITFDIKIEEKIKKWEYGDFETVAEQKAWEIEFLEYFSTLVI